MLDWPEGVDRIQLDRVDSTNAEARRRTSTLQNPTWIMASEQTHARGRRGRNWHSPEGNFSATLLMRPETSLEKIALRSFVAALALRDAMIIATGQEDIFTLKWPNDVLLSGGKIAGILLETIGGGSSAIFLSLGIGVNLAVAPSAETVEPDAIVPKSLLGETGKLIMPLDFLNHLAPAYAYWENQMQDFGFGRIRTEWLAHAERIGEEVTARMGRREVTGLFETIDENGALIIQSPERRHVIAAADVFFT